MNTRAARGVLVAEALWGVALIVAPRRVMRPAQKSEPDRREVVIARVLGSRHVLQAAVLSTRPTRTRMRAGSAINGLHAASLLFVAGLDAPNRRIAAWDSAIAATWCAAALLVVS